MRIMLRQGNKTLFDRIVVDVFHLLVVHPRTHDLNGPIGLLRSVAVAGFGAGAQYM